MSKNRNRNRPADTLSPATSVRTAATVLESFQGPIPPPAVLEGYKAIDPALPLKLMELAINEQEHRHHLEKRKVDVVEQKFANQATGQRDDFRFGTRGQWLAFVLAIIFLGVIVFLGWRGMETAICAGFGAGGFVAVFTFLAPRLFGKFLKDKKDS